MTSDWNMMVHHKASNFDKFVFSTQSKRHFGLICQIIDKKPTDYRRVISIFVQIRQSMSKVKVMVVM